MNGPWSGSVEWRGVWRDGDVLGGGHDGSSEIDLVQDLFLKKSAVQELLRVENATLRKEGHPG